jgi:Predicted branched-chain amino acid permease (azaleucine resistance)
MNRPDGEIRQARSQGIQVALAVSLYGMSFGALAMVSGFSLWQTMVLSLVMFSGASQFAVIGIVATGGVSAGLTAVLSAGLLGVRNGLYALRMSALLEPRGWTRLAAAQLTVDESTAVATAQPSRQAAQAGFWTTAVALFLGWNLSTLVGALLGDVIGDVRSYGLDAAAAAAFLGLVWPWLRVGEPVVVAIGAAVVSIVLLPLVPAGVPVLIVAVLAIAFGVYRHRVAPEAPPREEAV